MVGGPGSRPVGGGRYRRTHRTTDLDDLRAVEGEGVSDAEPDLLTLGKRRALLGEHPQNSRTRAVEQHLEVVPEVDDSPDYGRHALRTRHEILRTDGDRHLGALPPPRARHRQPPRACLDSPAAG